MGITHYPLPKNNVNLPLPFFGGSYPIVLLDNIYYLLFMYIHWFAWRLFFVMIYVIPKIGGHNNSPNSLNVMVNYHYHG